MLLAGVLPLGAATGTARQSTTPVATASAASVVAPVRAQRCFGAATRDPRATCSNRSLRRVVEPAPFDALVEPSEPCDPVVEVGFEACTLGASPSTAVGTIALLGDSHATHWRAALARVAEAERLRIVSITRSGCPFTLAISRGRGLCGGWAQRVIDWLGEHPEVSGVVTSSSTGTRMYRIPGLTQRETAIQGFQEAWAALPPSIRDVWVIRDVPHMTLETLSCIDDAINDRANAGTRCAQSRTISLPPDLSTVALRRAGSSRAHLIDLTAFMCDSKRCFPVVGGALVSKDAGHLTRTFSSTMGPYLRRAMASTKLRDRVGVAGTTPASTTPTGTFPSSTTP